MVYAGQETKIQMNSLHAPSKMSKLEQNLNTAIIIIFFSQVVLVSISVLSVYLLGFDDTSKLPYVFPPGTGSGSILPLWLELWFVFFLLYNNFIPLSLYVTIEIVNLGQSFLIGADEQLYNAELDVPCTVRASNLVQELGMVSNVFTDKTGTLTKNEMKLVKYVLNGRIHDVAAPPLQAGATVDVNADSISPAEPAQASLAAGERIAHATANGANAASNSKGNNKNNSNSKSKHSGAAAKGTPKRKKHVNVRLQRTDSFSASSDSSDGEAQVSLHYMSYSKSMICEGLYLPCTLQMLRQQVQLSTPKGSTATPQHGPSRAGGSRGPTEAAHAGQLLVDSFGVFSKADLTSLPCTCYVLLLLFQTPRPCSRSCVGS